MVRKVAVGVSKHMRSERCKGHDAARAPLSWEAPAKARNGNDERRSVWTVHTVGLGCRELSTGPSQRIRWFKRWVD